MNLDQFLCVVKLFNDYVPITSVHINKNKIYTLKFTILWKYRYILNIFNLILNFLFEIYKV